MSTATLVPRGAVSRRKKKTVVVAAAASGPSSIQKVVGMLKDKDALAAAFLLREILGPPRSLQPIDVTAI